MKNGVVCPGADAELAALHPCRLFFSVSEMRAADPELRRRSQQPGKMRDTDSTERKAHKMFAFVSAFGLDSFFIVFRLGKILFFFLFFYYYY